MANSMVRGSSTYPHGHDRLGLADDGGCTCTCVTQIRGCVSVSVDGVSV